MARATADGMVTTGQKLFRTLLSSISLCAALSIATADHEPYGDVLSMFYDSSRVFATTPPVGITLLSTSTDLDAILINGVTEDIVLSFSFLPPPGATLSQYSVVYVCETGTVASTDSCMVDNVESEIVGSTTTAFNTTVTCAFDMFPGSTSCQLTATPISSVRQDTSPLHQLESVKQSSLPSYQSEPITNTVFGIVFYIPDASGSLSSDATIVSGEGNAYSLDSYDRMLQGIREVSIAGTFPGGVSVSGSAATTYFASAVVSVEGERNFEYDVSACSLTEAEILNGVVSLQRSDTCAVGIAALNSGGPAKLGVQFRPYKSGVSTLRMKWTSFGTLNEDYEQEVNFNITEAAPPIITGFEKSTEVYMSVPCAEVETLTVTGFNMRFADTRQLLVRSSDGTTTVWSQAANGIAYDGLSDTSAVTFESAGGLGSESTFTVRAIFGTEERIAIVLNPALALTVSFTTPPVLTSISPATSPPTGGETIVLTGAFEAGFGQETFVYIGGHAIGFEDLTFQGSTAITFVAPPIAELGQQFSYEVSVGLCAERSNSQLLVYQVGPTLIITVVNSSPDESGSHIVPTGGSLSFLAEVAGNNDGISYVWKVFTANGQEVTTTDIVTNAQLFTISSSLLTSTSEIYTIKAEATNSLGLTDSKEVSATVAAEAAEYITVKIYNVEDLTRSSDAVTLLQATVSIVSSGDTTSVVALQDSEVVLEWFYRGSTFKVDGESNASLASSEVTGPTQLGLEFNIAQQDLQVGTEDVELQAYLSSKPTVRGSDKISLNVVASPLIAEINDGVNGSLALSSTDLFLSGAKSSDPDVLKGEGDSFSGIEYEWFSCKRALRSSFNRDVEDCLSMLPVRRTTQSLTITSAALSGARLDSSLDPAPTFFSFGLRATKGDRSSVAYLYFEVVTLATPERVPSLDSLEVVDSKGNLLSRSNVDLHGDIVIQPAVSDPLVSWAFDMVSPTQRFLFLTNGVLKTGSGFVSSRRQVSTMPLGFAAGSLEPSTEYRVLVTVSAADTTLQSENEISFTTADVPKLTCTGPQITTGIVSETEFTISAQLTFESQETDYCFFLVASPTKKFSVGKGCSSLPFASFTFPAAGSYGIECLAKTVSGTDIDIVTLDSTLVISTPTPAPGASQIEVLATRLSSLDAEITSCEVLRDHHCIQRLIAVAVDITSDVTDIISSDSSADAVALGESTRAYVARLSAISETLAGKTVFRPNQVENSIEQTLSLAEVPGQLIEDDNTIFSMMRQAQNAVDSTDSEFAQPIISTELVDKVSAVANLTMSTAFNIAQGGSSRIRLRNEDSVTRSSFGVVVNEGSRFIGQMRVQQESCGFSGRESTRFPDSLDGAGRRTSTTNDTVSLDPIEVNVKIACTRAQAATPLQGTAAKLEVCAEALPASELSRMSAMLVEIPKQAVLDTGFVTNIDSYVDELPFLRINGVDLDSLPDRCIQLTMERNSASSGLSTTFDDLVGGRLLNVTSLDNKICTPSTCYVLATDERDRVTFSENQITIETTNDGLFVAGNRTNIADIPDDDDDDDRETSLTGVGFRGVGQIARIMGAICAFAVVAAVATWVGVTSCGVVSAAEVPAGTSWEYVERDMFGRGLPRDGTKQITKISDIIPEGATPPERGFVIEGAPE